MQLRHPTREGRPLSFQGGDPLLEDLDLSQGPERAGLVGALGFHDLQALAQIRRPGIASARWGPGGRPVGVSDHVR